jgi:hypothetical protein
MQKTAALVIWNLQNVRHFIFWKGQAGQDRLEPVLGAASAPEPIIRAYWRARFDLLAPDCAGAAGRRTGRPCIWFTDRG